MPTLKNLLKVLISAEEFCFGQIIKNLPKPNKPGFGLALTKIIM